MQEIYKHNLFEQKIKEKEKQVHLDAMEVSKASEYV